MRVGCKTGTAHPSQWSGPAFLAIARTQKVTDDRGARLPLPRSTHGLNQSRYGPPSDGPKWPTCYICMPSRRRASNGLPSHPGVGDGARADRLANSTCSNTSSFSTNRRRFALDADLARCTKAPSRPASVSGSRRWWRARRQESRPFRSGGSAYHHFRLGLATSQPVLSLLISPSNSSAKSNTSGIGRTRHIRDTARSCFHLTSETGKRRIS